MVYYSILVHLVQRCKITTIFSHIHFTKSTITFTINTKSILWRICFALTAPLKSNIIYYINYIIHLVIKPLRSLINAVATLYQLYTKSMVTSRYLRGTANAHQWFLPYRWRNKLAPHTFVSK